MFDQLGNGAAAFKDKEILTLSCFGRRTHKKAHRACKSALPPRPQRKDGHQASSTERHAPFRGSWILGQDCGKALQTYENRRARRGAEARNPC